MKQINYNNETIAKTNIDGTKAEITVCHKNISEMYYNIKPDIPEETTVFECLSENDAEYCAKDFETFLIDGYGENAKWLIGLDVSDIMNVFNGTSNGKFYRLEGNKNDITEKVKLLKDDLSNLGEYEFLCFCRHSNKDYVFDEIMGDLNEPITDSIADIMGSAFVQLSIYDDLADKVIVDFWVTYK